jgi:hypothetical protein
VFQDWDGDFAGGFEMLAKSCGNRPFGLCEKGLIGADLYWADWREIKVAA